MITQGFRCRGRLRAAITATGAAFLFFAPVLLAQSAGGGEGGDPALKIHVFTFEHQSPEDALGEIRPLFSDRGSVELHPSGDTVILRDGAAELERILRRLRDFDHPPRRLRLEFHLLRAHRIPFSPQPESQGVSPRFVERLRQMLRYDTYESLSRISFLSREGDDVAYDFGDDLGMYFRVGTVLEGERVGLKDFRIHRRSEGGLAVPVLHANLVLVLRQTLAMVLMREEAANSALVIAITCNPLGGGAAAVDRGKQ